MAQDGKDTRLGHPQAEPERQCESQTHVRFIPESSRQRKNARLCEVQTRIHLGPSQNNSSQNEGACEVRTHPCPAHENLNSRHSDVRGTYNLHVTKHEGSTHCTSSPPPSLTLTSTSHRHNTAMTPYSMTAGLTGATFSRQHNATPQAYPIAPVERIITITSEAPPTSPSIQSTESSRPASPSLKGSARRGGGMHSSFDAQTRSATAAPAIQRLAASAAPIPTSSSENTFLAQITTGVGPSAVIATGAIEPQSSRHAALSNTTLVSDIHGRVQTRLSNRWTREENDRLKQNLPGATSWDAILRIVPRRTAEACATQARKLGIVYSLSSPWRPYPSARIKNTATPRDHVSHNVETRSTERTDDSDIDSAFEALATKSLGPTVTLTTTSPAPELISMCRTSNNDRGKGKVSSQDGGQWSSEKFDLLTEVVGDSSDGVAAVEAEAAVLKNRSIDHCKKQIRLSGLGSPFRMIAAPSSSSVATPTPHGLATGSSAAPIPPSEASNTGDSSSAARVSAPEAEAIRDLSVAIPLPPRASSPRSADVTDPIDWAAVLPAAPVAPYAATAATQTSAAAILLVRRPPVPVLSARTAVPLDYLKQSEIIKLATKQFQFEIALSVDPTNKEIWALIERYRPTLDMTYLNAREINAHVVNIKAEIEVIKLPWPEVEDLAMRWLQSRPVNPAVPCNGEDAGEAEELRPGMDLQASQQSTRVQAGQKRARLEVGMRENGGTVSSSHEVYVLDSEDEDHPTSKRRCQ